MKELAKIIKAMRKEQRRVSNAAQKVAEDVLVNKRSSKPWSEIRRKVRKRKST